MDARESGTGAPVQGSESGGQADVGALLSSLFGGAVAAEGGALGRAAGAVPGDVSGAPPGGQSGSPLSGLDLGALLRDPKVMSMLPQVMSMVSALSPGGTPGAPTSSGGNSGGLGGGGASSLLQALGALSAAPDAPSSGIGAESPDSPSGGQEIQPTRRGESRARRDALLLALRPYLSPRRQSVVDGVLKAEKIGKMLGG